MAKKEIKLIKAKALVNLKYDKDCYKIDEELKVRLEDAEKMAECGYIKLLEEPQKEEELTNEEGEAKEGE